jgi:putative oxidoreductase
METLNYQSPLAKAVGFYDKLACAEGHLQSAVLLALRLTWGWQLAESGYAHLTHIQQTVDAFKSWGVPFPQLNVYISGSTELFGGTLLILGLAARLISIPLVFNFIVAYATASKDTFRELLHGMLQKGYDDFINDAAFPMLMLALIMIAFGPGKASIDYLLRRKFFDRDGEHAAKA